ncbi:MAG: alanine racemase [Bacteroidales bacterium]
MAKKNTTTTIVGQEGKNDSFVYSVQDVASLDDYMQILHFAHSFYSECEVLIICTNSKYLTTMSMEDALAFDRLSGQLNIKSGVQIGNFNTKSTVVSQMTKYETLQDCLDANFFADVKSKMFFILGDVQETANLIGYLRGNTSHTISEINIKNIINNIDIYRSLIKAQTKIMLMLKADAYGCGMLRLGRLAEMSGVDYIGVFSVDEGVKLRKNSVSIPIMVMNVHKEDFALCVEYDLQASMPNIELLKELVERTDKKQIGIHLKVDTGMSRLGFCSMELFDEALSLIKKHGDRVKVMSVYSHLSCSEDPEKDDFTQKQFDLFTQYYKRAEEILAYKFIKHILNSAGVLRFPDYQFDMVRSGIGVYGGINYMDTRLKPIRSLLSEIISIKKIKAGQAVGYGGVAIFDEDRTIAVVPVGYADGYRRAMGNGVGRVYVKGHFAPVVGNICMDMFMIDITGLDVELGDVIEIYGKNIPIEEIAEKWNTISYEVMTSSSLRASRKYIINYSAEISE